MVVSIDKSVVAIDRFSQENDAYTDHENSCVSSIQQLNLQTQLYWWLPEYPLITNKLSDHELLFVVWFLFVKCLQATQVLRHWSLSWPARHWADHDRIIARSRNDDHFGSALITSTLYYATCIRGEERCVVWVLLRNHCRWEQCCGFYWEIRWTEHCHGRSKERIMEPVTTAPLTMADCISNVCLLANWQISV